MSDLDPEIRRRAGTGRRGRELSAELEPVSYRTARGPRTWEELRTEAVASVTAAAHHVTRGEALGPVEAFADAVLALLDDEALNRMGEQLADETRIKSIDYRNGVAMDLDLSKTVVAGWVAAAKAWLDHYEAVNYTETAVDFGGKVSAEVKIAGEFDRYVFILQKVGAYKKTPHELRRKAEAERDEALAEVARLRDLTGEDHADDAGN